MPFGYDNGMENKEAHTFYQSLSPIEQAAWHRLDELFQLVQPQKPEKGIKTLIIRARAQAAAQNIPLETALQQMITGASERTHKRLALLQTCSLQNKES